MKKFTKTIAAFIAVLSLSSLLYSCQEDAYPEFEEPQVVSLDAPDAKSETDPSKDDNGIEPR